VIPTNGQKKVLSEQDLVDRAARTAKLWFWWKVWILILIVVVFLVWVTTR